MDRLSDASGSVEAADAEAVVKIWPGTGVPPGSETWDWAESTMQVPWTTAPRRLSRNVVMPTLTVFRPAPGTANGTSMIIAPGGAFHFLMIDHEGFDLARWLAARGVTAFVLKYRLGRTPDADADLDAFRSKLQIELAASRKAGVDGPVSKEMWGFAVEDGRQAIRFVRGNAARWDLDPARIGISGFSAGGAVAMGVALEHDAACRPDYAVGVYPPLRNVAVPTTAPPLFLIVSNDDSSVSPTAIGQLYLAWRAAGIPVEFHAFANGGHGWGMNKDGWLSDGWEELLGRWMSTRGLL